VLLLLSPSKALLQETSACCNNPVPGDNSHGRPAALAVDVLLRALEREPRQLMDGNPQTNQADTESDASHTRGQD
jgi:hypothetical protein